MIFLVHVKFINKLLFNLVFSKDIIEVKKNKKSQNLIKTNLISLNLKSLPKHLSRSPNFLKARVNSVVNRSSINLKINELLVVEYYSRKI